MGGIALWWVILGWDDHSSIKLYPTHYPNYYIGCSHLLFFDEKLHCEAARKHPPMLKCGV